MSNDVNFKKLNELEVIEEAGESTYAVVEENGVPKRIPGKKIGGGLPEGGAANQMLVTDSEGATKWDARTHYEETGYVIPLTSANGISVFEFPESVMTYDEETGVYDGYITVGWTASQDGEKCIVVFDGTAYESEYSRSQYMNFGNRNLTWEESPDTGEPFYFSTASTGSGTVSLKTKLPGSHTVKVMIYGTYVKPLDAKFMPAELSGILLGNEDSGFEDYAEDTYAPLMGGIYEENGVKKIRCFFGATVNTFSDLTDAPTANDFNNLLNVLRNYGIIAYENS